jgi:metal-responsive CopG/Arc/MetJ family transcriptional regulator
MARKQVIVQLDDDLVDALDSLAADLGVSRSELLRRGAYGMLEAHRVRALENEHADAYRRRPQDPVLTDALLRLASEHSDSW